MKTKQRRASQRVNAGAFRYHGDELFCEGVPMREVAKGVGTPAYVYSASRLVSNYQDFDRAFGRYPHMVCYSVKANANLHLLRLLARRGSAFDIVSGGELYRVLK